MCRVLLEFGASLETINHAGDTVVQQANKRGRKDVANMLNDLNPSVAGGMTLSF